jgi:putative two-component system response regulator
MDSVSDDTGHILVLGSADALTTVSSLLREQQFSIAHADCGAEAVRQIRSDPLIDMVLLIPGESLEASTELCRSIKFDRRSAFVAVVCLLPEQHGDRAVEVLEAGADDCIRLMLSPREVALRLRKAVSLKRATDSLEDSTTVITALANAVEGKDHYTCGHVQRVGDYCMEIGKRVGTSSEDLWALRIGGIVHDIGKIGIPDQILNKPGKLTEEEMAVIRRHPVIGHDILKGLRTFHGVLPIVRWHHEKPNGKGYPDGLAGEQIPLKARITAVADVFDALCTDRPYRPALAMPECKRILRQSGENGDLDARLVSVLFSILGDALPAALSPAA